MVTCIVLCLCVCVLQADGVNFLLISKTTYEKVTWRECQTAAAGSVRGAELGSE